MVKMDNLSKTEMMELIRLEPELKGESGLWLTVIFDAVKTIRTGTRAEGYRDAISFINEPGGMFDIFLESIDVDPSVYRQKISKFAKDKKRLTFMQCVVF
jgi:hypothetical protein